MHDVQDARPDPLAELERLLPEVPAAKEARALGTALSKASEQAAAIDGRLDRLETAAVLVPLCSGHLAEEREGMDKALDELEEIAARLSAAASREDLEELQFGLRTVPKDLAAIEQGVDRAWRRLVRGLFEGPAAAGAILSRIPATSSVGTALVQIGQSAKRIEGSPWDEASRTDLASLIERKTEVIQGWADGGAGDAITSFLRDVTSGVLPLSRLTPEIYSWLKDNQALDLFTVSLARSARG